MNWLSKWLRAETAGENWEVLFSLIIVFLFGLLLGYYVFCGGGL